MVREGQAEQYWKRKHGRARTYMGIRMLPAPPPPSSSEESPRSITFNEMQVNAFARAIHMHRTRKLTGYEQVVIAKVDANDLIVAKEKIVNGPGWLYRGKQQGYGVTQA